MRVPAPRCSADGHGQGHSGPATNVKEIFGLTDSEAIDNRPDAPDQQHLTCNGQDLECLDLGWYDIYAVTYTPCQWVPSISSGWAQTLKL